MPRGEFICNITQTENGSSAERLQQTLGAGLVCRVRGDEAGLGSTVVQQLMQYKLGFGHVPAQNFSLI